MKFGRGDKVTVVTGPLYGHHGFVSGIDAKSLFREEVRYLVVMEDAKSKTAPMMSFRVSELRPRRRLEWDQEEI